MKNLSAINAAMKEECSFQNIPKDLPDDLKPNNDRKMKEQDERLNNAKSKDAINIDSDDAAREFINRMLDKLSEISNSDVDDEEKVRRFIEHYLKNQNFENALQKTRWSSEHEERFEKIVGAIFKRCPRSLYYMFKGILLPGDCGRSSMEKPDWLDMDKFRRGQKFAVDHAFNLCYGQVLGLLQLYTFPDGLKPMIFTRKSHTPYLAYKRYLSTALRLRNWYTSDPWLEGSPAYNDIQSVRKMHLSLREKLAKISNKEFDERTIIENAWCPMLGKIVKDAALTCSEPAVGQCPYAYIEERPDRPQGMNQGSMSVTQFAFISAAVLFPRDIGIHDATEEDMAAFCHVWRVIGFLLGIEDEYNFCRGSLEDIRKRARDFSEYWAKPNLREVRPEWEHMCRCLIDGVTYYYVDVSFEVYMLHLMELLHLDLPNFYAAVSYKDWITFHLIKMVYQYPCRIPGFLQQMSKALYSIMERAINFPPEKNARLERRSAKTLELSVESKSDVDTNKSNSYFPFANYILGLFFR